MGEVLRRAHCYELGLFPNATKAQIRRAYRSLSLEFHPDKNPGDQRALRKFNRVARANEVLTDDEQRKKLDYYTENPSEYWSGYGPSWTSPTRRRRR